MDQKEILASILVMLGAIVFAIFGILIRRFFEEGVFLFYVLLVFLLISLGYLVLYLKLQHNANIINNRINNRLDNLSRFVSDTRSELGNILSEDLLSHIENIKESLISQNDNQGLR